MKLKLFKKVLLGWIAILFIKPLMAYTGTIEEGLTPFHISLMFILMLLLLTVVYMSFKSWDIFKEREFSFSFKLITFGLIVLGMNEALVISSHSGIINFTSVLQHFINIAGYLSIGIGLYLIIRSNSKQKENP